VNRLGARTLLRQPCRPENKGRPPRGRVEEGNGKGNLLGALFRESTPQKRKGQKHLPTSMGHKIEKVVKNLNGLGSTTGETNSPSSIRTVPRNKNSAGHEGGTRACCPDGRGVRPVPELGGQDQERRRGEEKKTGSSSSSPWRTGGREGVPG